MELDVWKGDWGLPSIDHCCLTVMAYCKFSDVPVKFIKTHSWKAFLGDFPVLKHELGLQTQVTDIFDCLRKQNWGTDHDLTAKQSADIVAFITMMEHKLLPGLMQLWWGDAKNYLDLTRPWYAKAIPFPLNMYLPSAKRAKILSHLEAVFPGDNSTDKEREIKIYKDAKECLNLLSAKLGEKDYFLGEEPTSLDAVVFGYVAPILKISFPNSMLQNHLKGCPNLCQLCNKILSKFFPLTPEETEALKKKEENQRQTQAGLTEFPNRKRNIIIAGVVGLTAMISYAFLSGLIQIEIMEDNSDAHSLSGSQQPKPPNFNQFDDFVGGTKKEEKSSSD